MIFFKWLKFFSAIFFGLFLLFSFSVSFSVSFSFGAEKWQRHMKAKFISGGLGFRRILV